MFKRRRNVGLMFVVLALVLALASCAPAESGGDRARIGLYAGFTGAIATAGAQMSESVLNYEKHVNESGGINGVQVECLWEECAYMVPHSITAHRRFKEKGVLATVNYSSGQVLALVPSVLRDEMPMMYAGVIEQAITKPAWVFVGGLPYGMDVATYMKWGKDEWKETRPPRIGIMVYDHTSGWSVINAAKEWAPKFGFEFVGYEVIPLLGAIDTSVEWLRLAGKNPDMIFGHVAGASLVTQVKDAARLGIQDKGIKLASAGALDETVIGVVGKEDVEGWYVTASCLGHGLLAGDKPAGLKTMEEAAQKYRGRKPEEINAVSVYTWVCAQLAVEGIRLAIEKVGLENLDGRAVRDALVTIRDFETGVIPPVTLTDDNPYYTKAMRWEIIEGGKYVPVSDWYELVFFFEAQ